MDDDSEEEVYSEEDYEESFIDDPEEVGDGSGSDTDVAMLPLFHRDEDDEDPPIHQRNNPAPIVISSDEEDDLFAHASNHYRDGEDEYDDHDYHDARSDSVLRIEEGYFSEYRSDDDDYGGGFYGYM